MGKKLWSFIVFLVLLSIPLGTTVTAESNYEQNINQFINEPNKPFDINQLVEGESLKDLIREIVGSDEVTYNQLKQEIEKVNEEKNFIVTYGPDEGRLTDFKVFSGIKLNNLTIYLEHENTAILNPDYFEYLYELSIISEDGTLKEVDLSGFKNLAYLEIESDKIHSIQLPKVDSLESIQLDNLHINELVFEDLEYLNLVRIYNSKINNVVIKNLENFNHLELDSNTIDNLIIENMDNLYSFGTDFNHIKNFHISNVPRVDELFLANDFINNLYVNNVRDLNYISIYGSYGDLSKNLESITLTNLPNLEAVSLWNTKLEEVNFSNLPKLDFLDIRGSNIASIDLSDDVYSKLEFLTLSEAKLKNIDVTPLKNLIELDVSFNELSEIDLTGLSKLKLLDVSENKIKSLNLKDQKQLELLFASSNNLTTIKFVEDVMDTLYALLIHNNEINLNSKVNKPIHEKLKKQLTGFNEFGENYQFDSQRVDQVDETKSSGGKKSDGSKPKTDGSSKTGQEPNTDNGKNKVVKAVLTKVKDALTVPILDSKSRVVFPDDLPENTVLEVSTIAPEEVEKLLEETSFELAGDIFEFTLEDGVEIDKPFKLELYFDKDKYPSDKWDVGIYYYNEETGEWELQESVIDAENSIVYTYVDHFSTYGVLAKPKEVVDGNTLPATATENFNIILIGFTLLIAGLISFAVYRRKSVN